MSVPETDEERLNRTNNFRILENPKGIPMATLEPGETEYVDPEPTTRDEAYEPIEGENPRAERYEPQFSDFSSRARTWLAELEPERLMGWALLGVVGLGLLRRRHPKKVRVDMHHYVHTVKK